MELLDLVRQFAVVKKELSLISERESALKAQIKKLMETAGEVDDKGSRTLELDDEVSNVAKVIYQRKVSKSLNSNAAEELLESRGLLDQCVQMIPVLDEEEIMKAYYEGELDEEDIDTMFPEKESFALILKEM